MSYKIVNMWTPQNMFRIKAPFAMNPGWLTIHNTGNNASARNEIAYMNRNNNQTSYHAAIDDKEVVQAIPFNRNAWHAGDGAGNGNRRSIGIEICYSTDNGYSGAYSARHRQAEENAALYAAHILNQMGWGVGHLRQHWDWSRKDCPHKMRAHKRWNAFKNRVGQHLAAIKKTGQSAKETSSAPTQKGWQTNAHGTQWIATKGVWINGNQEITKRRGAPKLNAPTSGQMPKGQRLDYREMARSDGHIWLLDLKSSQWVPVKTWNPRTGAVGKDWGTWK